MKSFFKLVFSAVILSVTAVSCFEDYDQSYSGEHITKGVYVLNEGDWGANNSEVTFYNPDNKEVVPNVFLNANGKQLGDTANDMLIYGSKMYIAVTGSSVIFVTDLKGKIIKEIKVAGSSANLSPRKLDCEQDKVYVTFMEGYVGAIDTTDFSVETVQVGPMPEGIACVYGKIYVANSDGYNPAYGNTVSVIDAKTFKVIKTLQVGVNPQQVCETLNRVVYVVCNGNYADIPAQLYRIDTNTDQITAIPNLQPTEITIGAGGVAYIISSTYDSNWNQTIKYLAYDTYTDTVLGEFTNTNEVPNGYCINSDPYTGKIYIGSSDYVSNGDVYVLSPEGDVLDVFDTGAINPTKICFMHEYKLERQ